MISYNFLYMPANYIYRKKVENNLYSLKITYIPYK